MVDIRLEYEGSDVLVAPLSISGGTKFKILEAFASGLPVVTTKEGAAGIDAASGKHYLEASKPQDFVGHIAKIWENGAVRKRLITNARKLVEDKYSWDSIAKTLDSVWRKVHGKNT